VSEAQKRFAHMIAALKKKRHRITPQRYAVLRILAESKDHPSVEQVFKEVRHELPCTSLATVYKTITLLKELGEVLELGFAGWGSRYDGKKPFPHPHVICTECGAIDDPEFPVMAELARQMAAKSGYAITHHRLDFFGRCPACRKRA